MRASGSLASRWSSTTSASTIVCAAWFPLPIPAMSSAAECAFAVVERGLTAEGGPTEVGLPTFPSRRFVGAGGLTIAHEGLVEYELVDVHEGGARALAVTLLRSTGFLSRGPMATRALPAGPIIAMSGSQVLGQHTWRYAIALGDVDGYTLVDDAFLPMHVANGQGRGNWSDVGDMLRVAGAEVSSVRRVGSALEVRVFNPTPQQVQVDIGHRTGWLVDLTGRTESYVEGSFSPRPVEDRDAQVELTSGEQRLTSRRSAAPLRVQRRHTDRHGLLALPQKRRASTVPPHRERDLAPTRRDAVRSEVRM